MTVRTGATPISGRLRWQYKDNIKDVTGIGLRAGFGAKSCTVGGDARPYAGL